MYRLAAPLNVQNLSGPVTPTAPAVLYETNAAYTVWMQSAPTSEVVYILFGPNDTDHFDAAAYLPVPYEGTRLRVTPAAPYFSVYSEGGTGVLNYYIEGDTGA